MSNDLGMPRRKAPTVPGTRTHHAGNESHLFRELMRTHQAVLGAFTRCVGAPSGRIGLLRLLAIGRDEFGTKELARRLGVDPAGITRQLKEMEAEGLVTRTPHATDRRRTVVKLTRAGIESFRMLHEYGHAYERRLAAEVSKKDITTALRVLQAMREVVLRSVSMGEEDVP